MRLLLVGMGLGMGVAAIRNFGPMNRPSLIAGVGLVYVAIWLAYRTGRRNGSAVATAIAVAVSESTATATAEGGDARAQVVVAFPGLRGDVQSLPYADVEDVGRITRSYDHHASLEAEGAGGLLDSARAAQAFLEAAVPRAQLEAVESRTVEPKAGRRGEDADPVSRLPAAWYA